MKFRDKFWVYVGLLTLITALVWLGVSVHAAIRKSTIPADVDRLVAPMDPNLDTDLLAKLAARSHQGVAPLAR